LQQKWGNALTLQDDPKDAKVYNNRGNLKRDKLNDIEGALADYNQAITLNPEDGYAYGNRANLKKNKLNDKAGAIEDLRQSVVANKKLYGDF
jgi:tetratricopeptide (TPR) repeat protein